MCADRDPGQHAADGDGREQQRVERLEAHRAAVDDGPRVQDRDDDLGADGDLGGRRDQRVREQHRLAPQEPEALTDLAPDGAEGDALDGLGDLSRQDHRPQEDRRDDVGPGVQHEGRAEHRAERR